MTYKRPGIDYLGLYKVAKERKILNGEANSRKLSKSYSRL